jgi:antitoxin ParD1/3/4
MNVSLTPQLEAMIRAKVESGMYNNASEVVREALRIMEREERKQRFRQELDIGFRAIEEGRTVAFTPELVDKLKAEAIRRSEAGVPISDAIKP